MKISGFLTVLLGACMLLGWIINPNETISTGMIIFVPFSIFTVPAIWIYENKKKTAVKNT